MEKIFLNSSGNKLVATVFQPAATVEYAVIMSSATGAKQQYFEKFARYLCEKGMLAVTYDYSGIGQSAPKKLKGYKASATAWGQNDLTTVIDHVSSHFQCTKLVLIGQSIGGQIAGLSPSITKVHGLVNVASQSGYWRLWPVTHRFFLLFNWYFLDFLVRIFGYFPGKKMGIMENLPKDVALEWSKWGRSPNYLFDHVPGAHEKFSKINVPLISYSFSDDTTAPKNTVEWLNRQYKNCNLTHKHIQPSDINEKSIGHFGFFRTKCKVLWDDVIKEIQDKV